MYFLQATSKNYAKFEQKFKTEIAAQKKAEYLKSIGFEVKITQE